MRALSVILLCVLAPALVHAKSCESLAKLASPTAIVTLTTPIDAGSFSPNPDAKPLANLPAFCRVAATLKPTTDSDIHTEVWMPASGWNGKLLALGSGGWGGALDYEGMGEALRHGYATSATDDGHAGGGGSFIMGHPEKFIDFGYRAEHEMTVEAKALIKAFYGRDARHSYWQGCSGGGREGLLQAARYPDEFDGVIAGDPADVRRNAWALWLAIETFKEPAARIPPEKYAMIHRAVLDACDASDGLKDGLISEPQACHVDFKTLECKGADGAECLTPRQVQSAQTILTPATTPSGDVLFPRLEPGTEMRWARLAGSPTPADLFLDQFRYVVYQNENWDWRTFDLARDAAKASAANRGVLELDPNLAAFEKRGGKLLIYHGWADQQVAPGASIEFYNSVLKLSAQPSQASNWIRLFMVPGMGHCSGGEGPDDFDTLTALEQWVEHGKAPDRIIAAHHASNHLTANKSAADSVDRTRPLCPYPQVARYNGSGSSDDASNFTCRLR